MNKRGLSDVVTNVLIILLVLVAVGIIWAFLRPTIEAGAGHLDSADVLYGLDFSLQSYSVNGDNINLVVKRSAGAGDADLIGLNVILEDDSGATQVERWDGTIEELGTQSIDVQHTGGGTLIKISIAPIIMTMSGAEKFGAIAYTKNIGSGRDSNPPATCNAGEYQTCDYSIDNDDSVNTADVIYPDGRNYCSAGAYDGSCESCYVDYNSDGIKNTIDVNDFVADCSDQVAKADCNGDGSFNCGPGQSDFVCFGTIYAGSSCY